MPLNHKVLFSWLSCALMAMSLCAQPTQEYSHGEPTDEEQQLLEMINRARAHPAAEGQRLVTSTDPDVVGAYNFFEVVLANVSADFNSYPARPPLAFHPLLIEAARNHTLDMAENDFQGHNSFGSTTIFLPQRLAAVGYTGADVSGENVYAYADSMWHAHAGFNVDWGGGDRDLDNDGIQDGAGHRVNIMNPEGSVFREIGIGVLREEKPATDVGPWVVTQNFVRRDDVAFLVGVVYVDANSNNFYDPGEGLPNVKITPSSGDWYAYTSASGGYAIPLAAQQTINGVNHHVQIPVNGTPFPSIIPYRDAFEADYRSQNAVTENWSLTLSGFALQNPVEIQATVVKPVVVNYRLIGTDNYYYSFSFILHDNLKADAIISGANQQDGLWVDARGEENGWKESRWLGGFWSESIDAPFIAHGELGLLEATAVGDEAYWLAGQDFFLWTTESLFPYVHEALSNRWYRFMGAAAGYAIYYDLHDGSWRTF